MPPKGSKKTPSCLGTVYPHHDGWRVRATIGGRTVCGPYRLERSDADADLSQARGAETHEGYCNILKQLRESAQSSGGWSATQPAHSKNEEGVVGAAVVAGGLEAEPRWAGEKRPTEAKKTMTQRRQTVFAAAKGSCGLRACGNCGTQRREASQRDVSFVIKQTAVASTNMYRLH